MGSFDEADVDVQVVDPSVVNSASRGDPSRHLSLRELHRALAVTVAPKTHGRLTHMVRRCEEGGRRELLQRARLTPERGMPGDAWERKPLRFPEAQLAVVQTNVAELIANGQPIGLSGDNLYMDLDLSNSNLEPGTHLRIVDVLLEVTTKAHNGCKKFATRFGHDALRFVSEREHRHRNLRGIYMRVLQAGDVKVGDVVEVLKRKH
jgi:hypothetical protein